MAKTKPTENPIIPFVQEIGKDLGIIVQNTQTIVERLSATSSSANTETSSASTSHVETGQNNASPTLLQDQTMIKRILDELTLHRDMEKKRSRIQAEWESVLFTFSRIQQQVDARELPFREGYKLRVYPSAEHRSDTVPLPQHLVGKTGFYRFKGHNDSIWEMSYEATVFSNTLSLPMYSLEGYFDVEFFIVNDVGFTPDEEIRL